MLLCVKPSAGHLLGPYRLPSLPYIPKALVRDHEIPLTSSSQRLPTSIRADGAVPQKYPRSPCLLISLNKRRGSPLDTHKPNGQIRQPLPLP